MTDDPQIVTLQDNTTLNGNNAAGNSTTPSPNDQQNKSQHDSTNKNSGDDHPTPTPMNTNENPVTSDDVTKYLALSLSMISLKKMNQEITPLTVSNFISPLTFLPPSNLHVSLAQVTKPSS